ncbi:BspC domain-containing protein [Candidatus Pandoraea novymonadis]|uniref:Uncharacterized protein n=1 Tax=Candidatus Pandoraea novymonadis TaxID=1808959 RepID=A0ABX5FEN2_9BURK|nr:hypothetical protein [Candidatus Pandoraea novymonadis]PSB92166.1 hypothetical protein BZL35_00397 [Candidatus Pandoraea novymonadis]
MSNRILIRIFLYTAATAALFLSNATHAVTLQQHHSLVKKFVNERHVELLIADCAAHASFVISTLPRYSMFEYNPDATSKDDAKIEAWDGPFDQDKQKIYVTQVVTLDGIGQRNNGEADTIHIRCGYADGHMMAFDYTTPFLTIKAPKSTAHSNKYSQSNSRANAVNRKRKKKNAR